jgi:hypothetical protein
VPRAHRLRSGCAATCPCCPCNSLRLPPQPLPSTPVLLLPSLVPRRATAVPATTGLSSVRSRERRADLLTPGGSS